MSQPAQSVAFDTGVRDARTIYGITDKIAVSLGWVQARAARGLDKRLRGLPHAQQATQLEQAASKATAQQVAATNRVRSTVNRAVTPQGIDLNDPAVVAARIQLRKRQAAIQGLDLAAQRRGL